MAMAQRQTYLALSPFKSGEGTEAGHQVTVHLRMFYFHDVF